MIKTKVLKKALGLRKSRLSDEVCIKVILDLCLDARDPQQASACATISAFFAEQRKELEYQYDRLEAEYMGHLEICKMYVKKETSND